ncbi:MAG: DUF1549 and DUF1553 domain-containing protein [Fuerstiella sp.]
MPTWCVILMLAIDVDSPRVDFDTQVMPVLTKAGCNSGSCHGAAAGRGEFYLSLYGSRPEQDFDQITRSLEGRRVNHRRPELSLLLQKPTEQQSHEGGTRLDIDGAGHALIRRWIAEGATRIQRRTLHHFKFSADHPRPAAVGALVHLTARAAFSDGTTEDVLPVTVLTADDPSAVRIDPDGTVTVLRPGRHLITARYLDQVTPLELLVPLTGADPGTTFSDSTSIDANDTVTTSPIDRFINSRLSLLGLKRAAGAADATLVRRLSLDLTGRLPTVEVAEHFAADQSADRRQQLIERLMASEAFVDYWTLHLAQLLRVNGFKADHEAVAGYYNWLRQAVADDRPLTLVARDLLLATGSVTQNPPASFYAVTADPRVQAEFVSQAFLGVRLQCANCHDHPLDFWTQDDYHGLAAIFARVKTGPVIQVSRSGQVIHPATGEPAVPKIPGAGFLTDSEDGLPVLAEWMTAKTNPYFGRAAVNRIWKQLMGRGLVEPVDDLRITNPATHPELLDWLTAEFADHDFRPKHLIRLICLSDAYARSSMRLPGQPHLPAWYATAISKPLSAEVYLDAVSDVTGTRQSVSPQTRSVRAVSLAGLTAKSAALDLLGRCTVGEACADAAVTGDDLSVQLHLLNGALLNQRLADPAGALMQSLQQGSDVADLITLFYKKAYSRPPAAEELTFWKAQFRDTDQAATFQSVAFQSVAQDFVWSLLSSEEFMENR